VSGALVAAATMSTEPSIGSSLLHMVLGLGGVILAILVVSKITQAIRGGGRGRTRSLGGGGGAPSARLEIIARQTLGKGVQVAVVRYGDKEVLVGIAGQNVTFYEEGATVIEAPRPVASEVHHEAIAHATATHSGARPASRDASLADLEAMLRHGGLGSGQSSAVTLLERLRAATERR
jgi:flagellar biogenesis protein FliO